MDGWMDERSEGRINAADCDCDWDVWYLGTVLRTQACFEARDNYVGRATIFVRLFGKREGWRRTTEVNGLGTVPNNRPFFQLPYSTIPLSSSSTPISSYPIPPALRTLSRLLSSSGWPSLAYIPHQVLPHLSRSTRVVRLTTASPRLSPLNQRGGKKGASLLLRA